MDPEVDRPHTSARRMARPTAGAALAPIVVERLPSRPVWSLQAEPDCWHALRDAAGLGAMATPRSGPWQAWGPSLRWLQIGPGEAWLLPEATAGNPGASGENGEPPLAATLESLRAQGLALACVAVGDAWVAWRMRGTALIDLLAQGCPLDLHRLLNAGDDADGDTSNSSSRPGPTGCVRTRLAQAPAVITVDDMQGLGHDITLWTERSHGAYVGRWLEAAIASL